MIAERLGERHEDQEDGDHGNRHHHRKVPALLEGAFDSGDSGADAVYVAVETNDVGVTNGGAIGDHRCIDTWPVEGCWRAEPLLEKAVVGSE